MNEKQSAKIERANHEAHLRFQRNVSRDSRILYGTYSDLKTRKLVFLSPILPIPSNRGEHYEPKARPDFQNHWMPSSNPKAWNCRPNFWKAFVYTYAETVGFIERQKAKGQW